jgi:hypothetical protein
VADNQGDIRHRPDHKGASYACFMLISKPECGDWLVIFVANPELGKAAFRWVHFYWCKSISHLAALSADDGRRHYTPEAAFGAVCAVALVIAAFDR